MQFKETFDLNEYGFKEGYLTFKLSTPNDMIKYNKEIYKITKRIEGLKDDDVEGATKLTENLLNVHAKYIIKHFIKGEYKEDGKTIEITKDDIKVIPPGIQKKLGKFIQGNLGKANS